MDAPVFSQLTKSRVITECIVLSVLQDEPALIHQNTGLKNPVGYLLNDLHFIGWICKNNIITSRATRNIFHGIAAVQPDIVHAQFFYGAMKEPCGFVICFHHIYLSGAAGGKFKTHAPGSGKKVQHCKSGKLKGIIEYIEQALTGEIGGWPGPERGGNRDTPPLVFSADYSQWYILNRLSSECSWIL